MAYIFDAEAKNEIESLSSTPKMRDPLEGDNDSDSISFFASASKI